MDSSRVKRIDPDRLEDLDDEVRIGSAFGFVSERALARGGLSWLTRRAGLEGPQVVPLLGDEPVDLMACTLTPLPLPRMRLESVTCDKALYREGADVVNLLVAAPLQAGCERTLRVDLHDNEHSRYELRLDASGCATVELRDLPVGRYSAALVDAEDDGSSADDDQAPTCVFTVAEYKLAPLTATLLERALDGKKLSLRLRLESFGVPMSGAVQLELLDGQTRIAKAREQAEDGELGVRFKLTGEGPHSVNVSLVDDPSRTASVPIVGSRAAEREEVVVSQLGLEIHASLLPSSGSTEVRGIHLREGGTRTSPIALERVDTRIAKLTARVTMRSPRVLVVDPCAPRRRDDAVDVASTPHPQRESKLYRVASEKFSAGDYENSLILFEAAEEGADAPHPYYPYYRACCLSHLGRRAEAVAALRAALELGFDEMAHMRGDEDLAALRGYAAFEALLRPAVREIECPALLQKDSTVPIAIDGPVALLALGGFIADKNDRPWEGWAAVITPSDVEAQLSLPEAIEPGEELTIGVSVTRGGAGAAAASGDDEGAASSAAEPGDASVYLIVKDARLLSPDTPSNRLAAGIKRALSEASEVLHTGRVQRKPSELPSPVPRYLPPPAPMMPPGAVAFGGAMPMEMAVGAPPMGAMPRSAPPMVMRSAAMPASYDMDAFDGAVAASAPEAIYEGALEDEAPEQDAEQGATTRDEPEVLFAALVPLDDRGAGEVSFTLPDAFTDYVCETFVLSGLDWSGGETRFRAAKDPFVSIAVAPFVRAGDGAIGTLHVGASHGPAKLELFRDGEPVALLRGDVPFSAGNIEGGNAALSFLAGPGRFAAEVTDARGVSHRVEREVSEPGKLRRYVRALRLLEEGDSVALSDDEGMISLRVLPSLDKPFKALVYATSDYGHACCEQTAAKMLAAAAMYAMASNEGDEVKRKRAESIVLAGVRRERKMFLPGRGFKMYPESGSSPDSYWGPKAARYLFNVALLGDIKPAPSSSLRKGIEACTEMAVDAAAAYKLTWPPKRPTTCEEAFAALRFGSDASAHKRALALARDYDANKAPGGIVGQRAEAAYAAATLFRGGARADFKRALALTNAVVGALGESGALYSTYDSVAAIALMAELVNAGVLGEGAGEVELDGEPVRAAEAVERGATPKRVACTSGVVPVEVTRMVEEDWDELDADVDMRVSLQREGWGSASRELSPGDLVELVVDLPEGYVAGDLLWLALPDALSAVEGGGQVKKRAFDFCGESSLRVPLTATALTVDAEGNSAPQHFAVCVRNMFEEERAGNPGPIKVTVTPGKSGGGGGLLDKAKALFAKLTS